MATPEQERDRAKQAMKTFDELTEYIENTVDKMVNVANALSDGKWEHVAIVGSDQQVCGRVPVELSNWPDGKALRDAIEKWRTASLEFKNAIEKLPPEEQRMFVD